MADADDDEETAPEALTVQAVLDLLRSPYRRYAVRFLADQPLNEPVPLVDLSEAAAQRETGADEIDDVAHKTAHVSLYQTHLPELETYGVVTTDNADDTNEYPITPLEPVQTLADILSYIDTQIDD